MPTLTGEQLTVIGEITQERNNQDAQWGGADGDDCNAEGDWLIFIQKQGDRWMNGAPSREVYIKIAALAIAAVESIDRKAKP